MLKSKVEAPDDLNPQETSEWVEALDDIIDAAGPDRASYLLERLMERAANLGGLAYLRRSRLWIRRAIRRLRLRSWASVPDI